jgi:hypothetical protein
MKTKIYGSSDDLIEIEGQINEEIGCFDHDKPIKFSCSDGTIGTIFYNGMWKIEIKTEGTLIQAVHVTSGDEHEHTGLAKGCTPYSDVLILAEGIEWVKIKGKTYKD